MSLFVNSLPFLLLYVFIVLLSIKHLSSLQLQTFLQYFFICFISVCVILSTLPYYQSTHILFLLFLLLLPIIFYIVVFLLFFLIIYCFLKILAPTGLTGSTMWIYWLYLTMYAMSYWGYILNIYVFSIFCTFFFIITTCPRCSSRQITFSIIILLFFLVNCCNIIIILPKAPVIVRPTCSLNFIYTSIRTCNDHDFVITLTCYRIFNSFPIFLSIPTCPRCSSRHVSSINYLRTLSIFLPIVLFFILPTIITSLFRLLINNAFSVFIFIFSYILISLISVVFYYVLDIYLFVNNPFFPQFSYIYFLYFY